MLTENDVTDIQKIALREILLVAAKMEGHDTEQESEVKRAGKLLGHYASARIAEIQNGDLNRPSYEEKERVEDWSRKMRYEISRAAQPSVPHILTIILQMVDEQLLKEGAENSVQRDIVVRMLNAISTGQMSGRLPLLIEGPFLG
jgi:hypothetical protein